MTSYMNTSSKLYDYILAIWKKFNNLRDVLDPLWVEFIRQLLSFALSLSKYNGAINQWLLGDIVVRNIPAFVVYAIYLTFTILFILLKLLF